MPSIQVAILGFGNVGRAFERFILNRAARRRAINIAAVADTSAGILLEKQAHLPSSAAIFSQRHDQVAMPSLRSFSKTFLH